MFACITLGVTFLYSREYLREQRPARRASSSCSALFGLLGIMVMISAHSLLTLYLGLELLALSLYTLVAFNRDSAVSRRGGDEVLRARRDRLRHAAVRHVAAVRHHRHAGARRAGRARRLRAPASVPVLLALAFVVVGIAFKFGAVPFHMWVPDVYQGAPTPVTLFIGSVPKIASFALAWRILVEGARAAARQRAGATC